MFISSLFQGLNPTVVGAPGIQEQKEGDLLKESDEAQSEREMNRISGPFSRFPFVINFDKLGISQG